MGNCEMGLFLGNTNFSAKIDTGPVACTFRGGSSLRALSSRTGSFLLFFCATYCRVVRE